MTAQTLTLTDFLLARIAEDEMGVHDFGKIPAGFRRGVVRNAQRQEEDEKRLAVTLGVGCPTCQVGAGEACLALLPPGRATQPASKPHGERRALGRAEYRRLYGGLTLWNEPRILAECAAKRAIVERHRQSFDICAGDCAMREASPCPTIRALASIYADHPDFNPDWARR